MLLVELHHLRVQLLRFLLELLAQVGDLGRQLALLGHRLALRGELEICEGRQQRPDDDRQDEDRSRPWRTDGSARCAPPPSSPLETTRISRLLHMCIASKTGSSGTKAEGASKKNVGNRGSWPVGSSSWLELRKPDCRLLGLRLQVGKGHLQRGGAGDQDHVISYSQSM